MLGINLWPILKRRLVSLICTSKSRPRFGSPYVRWQAKVSRLSGLNQHCPNVTQTFQAWGLTASFAFRLITTRCYY